MILFPDSSVWINASRNLRTSATDFIAQREHEEVATTGIVVQEVLQGFREGKTYNAMREKLWGTLILHPHELSTYEAAVQLYRRAREKGFTIRKPNDCLIAAIALEHGAMLVHNDRDFLALAQVEPELLIYPGRAH